MKGVADTLVASLTVAAVSTAGDLIWATWIPTHGAVYGLAHGTLLFCAIGFVLGRLAGRPRAGAAAGAAIGIAAAALFYVGAPLAGWSMMFVVWFGIWVAIGSWYSHLNGAGWSGAAGLARGALAAAGSGLAFYSVAGIWMPFDPEGWDYAIHFLAWTAAYVPGFGALLLARRSVPPAGP